MRLRYHLKPVLVLLAACVGGVLVAGGVESPLEQAWQATFAAKFSLKTSILYGLRPEYVKPASEFTNGLYRWVKGAKDGYGRGMGDCAIINGVALSGLVDKFAVTKDKAVREQAAKLVRGLLNLASSHGYTGFVARGLCAEDGRSICALSSVDQYTHWYHGLWRYAKSPLASAAEKAEIARRFVEVTTRTMRNISPDNGYDFLQADGAPDPRGICHIWNDAPPKAWKSVHGATRLPMFLAATWDLTKDAKWKSEYEKCIDTALAVNLRLTTEDPWQWRWVMPTYSLLQMSSANEVLYGVEKDAKRREKIAACLRASARIAADRAVDLETDPKKWYGMAPSAEAVLAALMVPDGTDASEEARRILAQQVNGMKPTVGPTIDVSHWYAAWWRGCRCGSVATTSAVSLDRDRMLRIGGLSAYWTFTLAPGWSKAISNGPWSAHREPAEFGGEVEVTLSDGPGRAYRLAATFPRQTKFTAARLNLPLPLMLRFVVLDGKRLDLPRTVETSAFLGGGKCRSVEIPLVTGETAVLTGDLRVSIEDRRKYNAGAKDFMLIVELPREDSGDVARFDLKFGVEIVRLPAPVAEGRDGTVSGAYDWPKGVPYFKELTRQAGAEWVACDFARTTVAGSPLDFSGLFPQGKRYFGGNCSWSAAFLEHDESDALADELKRLGYNIVRAHQHDTQFLPQGATDSTALDPEKLDRFDYFVAAMKRRGIAFTTDCYSSRKFLKTDPGLAAEAGVYRAMKTALLTNPAALANWKAFARQLLTHENPYTGLALKDDPTLVCLNLVNEDNQSDAEAQYKIHQEQVRFLKEEVGVKAPLTSLNMMSGVEYAWRRELFDVIDLHQYFAHPANDRGRSWMPEALASQLEPARPAAIWRGNFCQRFYDRPCFLTEWRQVPPNVFRSEAGPVMGAYAALQGLDGLVGYGYLEGAQSWRGAAYAHNVFDTAGDPLSLFSERIAAFMFRRGDVKTSARAIAIVVPDDVRTRTDLPKDFPVEAKTMGLLVRMGLARGQSPDGVKGIPLAEAAARLGPHLPTNGVYVSSTGEITLDTTTRQLRVVTPKTESLTWSTGAAKGRFLSAGEIAAPMTVSAHALDGLRLAESKSILVFHLTDSACTGEAYVDQTLKETTTASTRRAPMLIRRGAVDVRFGRCGYRVTALKCDGSVAGVVKPAADGSYRLATDLFPGGILAYHLAK